jgi:hypothetical protein
MKRHLLGTHWMRKACFALLFVVLGASFALGQTDTIHGSYCNVFYVTSDAQDRLPFNEQCFVSDEYSIVDPTNVRAIGPIEGSLSLFERYQWLLHFYLPNPKAGERLVIELPSDLSAKEQKMNPGKFFVTISDNRSSSRFDPILDNVDFAAVSGSAKVLEYEAAKDGEPFPSYKLQMDMRFKEVDRSQGLMKLIGEPIRIKLVIVIEPKS